MARRVQNQRPWPPTKFLDYEDTIDTNMGPARVLTDAGPAYIKPMADDVNPHNLAVEWVGTRLAAWFGLPVLDHCILVLGQSDVFPRRNRPAARHGPAFATRAVVATRWDGTPESLAGISNLHDIPRLVVFDTWIRNEDRYPPVNSAGAVQSGWRPNLGNVLLARHPPRARKLKMIAMDFGHALVRSRELPRRGFGIGADKEELVYGLFPEFRRHVTPELVNAAAGRLAELDRPHAGSIVSGIPPEWEVDSSAREALVEHLCRRAGFVSDNIMGWLAPLCWQQGTTPG